MVNAKVLLGWMDEDEAMSTLLRENPAQPPLTESEARSLWEEYRGRVAALPPRACAPPVLLADRTPKEEYEERYCIQKYCGQTQFLGVVKLDDPGKLVIHQLSVALPESEKYLRDMRDPGRRVSVCLGKGLKYEGLIPRARREGAFLVKPVPHYEFTVSTATEEDFQVEEENRYVTVKEFGGRMLLSTGDTPGIRVHVRYECG